MNKSQNSLWPLLDTQSGISQYAEGNVTCLMLDRATSTLPHFKGAEPTHSATTGLKQTHPCECVCEWGERKKKKEQKKACVFLLFLPPFCDQQCLNFKRWRSEVNGVRKQQLAGVHRFSCFSSDSRHPEGAIRYTPNPPTPQKHPVRLAATA